MKTPTLLFILLSINLSANIARGDEVLSLKNFERPNVFRSRYVEEKHLPSLSAPLKSEGDFIYIKNHGIAWLMDKPFSMQTVITPKGINQWVEGEKQPQSMETRKAMAPILKNIASIFSSDFEALTLQFKIKQEDRKTVSLTPKSQHLKPYLQQIIITGKATIEEIKIINAPDKFTITKFDKPVVGIKEITNAEKAFFDE